MKKYCILALLPVLLLGACSPAKPAEKDQNPSKDAFFAEIPEEKDLKSYVLTTTSEENFSSGEKDEVSKTQERLELIKDPKTSHSSWKSMEGEKTEEGEDYLLGKVRYYRENKGAWQKEDMEESKDIPSFVGQTVISPDKILKPLADYYEVREEENAYIAELKSDPDKVWEIQEILYGQGQEDPVLGQLQSFKAKFSFEKDSYLPLSFSWEASFLNKEKKISSLKQEGSYEKVNALEKIDLPPEVQNL